MDRDSPLDLPGGYSRIRESGEIAQVVLWNGRKSWLVTGHADARAVLSDARFSADTTKPGYPQVSAATEARRGATRVFDSMDDPIHKEHRRILMPDFTTGHAEALRPRVQGIMDKLLDEMVAAGPPADLVQALARPLPSLVICELLGAPHADHVLFERCSHRLLARTTSADEARSATDELSRYFMGLIEVKKREPSDDLVSRLVERIDAGQLTPKEVTDIAMLLLIAGHETTANMIALGSLTLLLDPEQLAELRKSREPAFVQNAVEELLRYADITQSGRRRVALEDVEIRGRVIGEGEGVIVACDAANRDGRVFPDPERLDLRRDTRRHLAFGHGAHQCIGQALARMELRVVHGTLWRRIPTLALDAQLHQLRFKSDMSVYGVHELPVTW